MTNELLYVVATWIGVNPLKYYTIFGESKLTNLLCPNCPLFPKPHV